MLQLVAETKIHAKIGRYSVDVFIPDWKLAVEYQGGQHAKQTWRGDLKRWISTVHFSTTLWPHSSQVQRDKDKQLFCKQQEITLVQVNHQWNGSWSQLKSTIRQSRPGTSLPVWLLHFNLPSSQICCQLLEPRGKDPLKFKLIELLDQLHFQIPFLRT